MRIGLNLFNYNLIKYEGDLLRNYLSSGIEELGTGIYKLSSFGGLEFYSIPPHLMPRKVGSATFFGLSGGLFDRIEPKKEIEESMPPERKIEVEGEETKTVIRLDRSHEIEGKEIPEHFDIVTFVPGRDGTDVEHGRITKDGKWWYSEKQE